jgi:hypothetical protein
MNLPAIDSTRGGFPGTADSAGPAWSAGAMRTADVVMTTRQNDFRSVIARAQSAVGRDRSQAAREAAEQFVATALVQPILGQLRATNHAAAPFGPTQGEHAFQQLADAQTAIGLVRKSRWEIVDRIAASIEQHGVREVKP